MRVAKVVAIRRVQGPDESVEFEEVETLFVKALWADNGYIHVLAFRFINSNKTELLTQFPGESWRLCGWLVEVMESGSIEVKDVVMKELC